MNMSAGTARVVDTFGSAKASFHNMNYHTAFIYAGAWRKLLRNRAHHGAFAAK